jgi:hypothetical protein
MRMCVRARRARACACVRACVCVRVRACECARVCALGLLSPATNTLAQDTRNECATVRGESCDVDAAKVEDHWKRPSVRGAGDERRSVPNSRVRLWEIQAAGLLMF